MAHINPLVKVLVLILLGIGLVTANENQQQLLGHNSDEPLLSPVTCSGDGPATQEQIDQFMAMFDRFAEEHRQQTATELYQEDRKKVEDMLDAQRTVWGMPTLAEEEAHTNTSAVPAFWARVLAEKGFADFGFVLFRLDYSNQSRWDAWLRTFDGMVEASMNATTRRSDVKAKKIWEVVNDKEELGGAQMQDIPRIFQLEMEVNPGQDLHVALMVDEAAMASLLDPQPGIPPWITAVNVYYNFENPLPRHDGYPGFSKVAVDSLIPHVWPLLANEVSSVEFWSWGLAYSDKIFEGFHLTERFRLEKWLGYSHLGLDAYGNELYLTDHDEDGGELYPKEYDEDGNELYAKKHDEL